MLTTILDGLNQRFGTETVFRAKVGERCAWVIKQEGPTPTFMSFWEDLTFTVTVT